MKKVKMKFKKGMALLLAGAMTVGMVPLFPSNAVTVQAADGTDGSAPNVAAYATKAQLMTEFTPNEDGRCNTIGKLAFGKNSGNTAQEWYILGRDSDVVGDNTIIFAASPLVTEQQFNPDIKMITIADMTEQDDRYSLIASCNHIQGTLPEKVCPNYYGISELRAKLVGMVNDDTTYFSTTEQGLMNDTTVTTEGEGTVTTEGPLTAEGTVTTENVVTKVTYTTTDKLYALQGDDSKDNDKKLLAGSSGNVAIAMEQYWNSGEDFWLRTPVEKPSSCAFMADTGSGVEIKIVSDSNCVRPASNLNLSSVLFASAAQASSSSEEAGMIDHGAAMALRLDGSGKAIGTVVYDEAADEIAVQKDANAGTASLVVQGKDGANDWYYSVPAEGKMLVTKEKIKTACNISTDFNFADCAIWLETTEDNVAYAKKAEAKSIKKVSSVEVTGMKPVGGKALNTEVSCDTEGIVATGITITYTTKVDDEGVEVTGDMADWNKTYQAEITLNTDILGDNFYLFDDAVSVTVDDETLADAITPNADGTLIVTKDFTTAKRIIESVTAPIIPTNNTYTNYYTESDILTNGGNSELGTQAVIKYTDSVDPNTTNMDVTWTLANDAGTPYDKTPGAENTFRWTVSASALTNYNTDDCADYDSNTGTITGMVKIANKAATPVHIIGTDGSLTYTGEDIDVTRYFIIGRNAGTPTYSLVSKDEDGEVTGVGTLDGNMLKIEEDGIFKVRVNTAARDIYAAGEKIITLTVGDNVISYTASDYSDIYDGQAHSIDVNVTDLTDTTLSYSTDGINYTSDNPSYTNAGTYTVYYRIERKNYVTVNSSKTVSIHKTSLAIIAGEQIMLKGKALNQKKYTETGLLTGDSIAEITLTPSTEEHTNNGIITISGVKIVNAAGEDVTGNYDITLVNGALKVIPYDPALDLDKIEVSKTKTAYTVGDVLNVDDLTVTAYYADSHSAEVTGFTTNVADIDMSVSGDKTLTVSYTEHNETKTENIIITVSAKSAPTPEPPGSSPSPGIPGNSPSPEGPGTSPSPENPGTSPSPENSGTSKINLSKSSVVIAAGKTKSVKYTATKDVFAFETAAVTASISDKKVISKVAVSDGEVKITVAKKAKKGTSATVTLSSTNAAGMTVETKIKVTVQNKVKKLTAKKAPKLKKGKKGSVTLKVTAQNNKKPATDTVKISSKKVSLVKYKVKKGKLTLTLKGKKKGTEKITVKMGSKKVKLTVKVK